MPSEKEETYTCWRCEGAGTLYMGKCPACNGLGKIESRLDKKRIAMKTSESEKGISLELKGSFETNPFGPKGENRAYANLRYFVDPLLRIGIKHETTDDVFWKIDKSNLFQAYIVCNDLFYWAVSDLEPVLVSDLEFLEKCYADCEAIDTAFFGGWLYCCRKRKMRPQGAAYKYIAVELRPLFDVCGPERETGFGNPLSQREEEE